MPFTGGMRMAAAAAFVMLASGWPAAAFDHAKVARLALENHIRPAYGRLAEAAAALEGKTQELCRAHSAASFDEAKKTFAAAVLAWSRIEHLRFGPVTEANRQDRFAFWPDPKGIGRRQVARALNAKDATVANPETLARKSAALQGLTALEYVLYGPGSEALSSDNPDREFRCGYALAIGRNVAGMARDIDAGWRAEGGFARLFLTPGADNAVYAKPEEVTQDLVQAYGTGLQSARELKFVAPLGFRKVGAAPEPAAYARSGLDRAVLIGNIEGVRDLFTQSGLAAELAAVNQGADRSILTELDLATARLAALKTPFAQAANDPQLKLKLAVVGFQLKNALETGGGQLSAAAGLSLGFNALDGD